MEIPLELKIEILKQLSLKDLIKMTLLDTKMNKLIKKQEWDNVTLRLYNLKKIQYVISTYKFKKFKHNRYRSMFIKKLSHIKSKWLQKNKRFKCKIIKRLSYTSML